VRGVDSTRLTPAQRHRLICVLARHRDYFRALAERMLHLNFPDDDPLYVAARRAYDAAHEAVKAAADPQPKDDGGGGPLPTWSRHYGRD
jgi:hypothetical protein